MTSLSPIAVPDGDPPPPNITSSHVPGGGTLSIRLPWPPAILSPNARPGHWAQRAIAVKAYRNACADAAWRAGVRPITARPLAIRIAFHPPTRIARDDDNCAARFKAGRDGIADAFGIDDALFRPTHRIAGPVKGGAVLVEFDLPAPAGDDIPA